MVTIRRNEFTVAIATLVLLVYIFALSVISQVVSPLVADKTISNTGSMRTIGVGVYWNENCTNEVSFVDWGILDINSSKNIKVYIRNEGNSGATLTMYASNWNPSNAADYIDFSWDYAGQVIDADEVHEVIFTLEISSDVQGIASFIFDTTVVGSS
ncbi:MAG: hypothetical protein PVF15_05965 [Candidatus Bathyarchaeota archaeon]|jgi:hypothetical protein